MRVIRDRVFDDGLDHDRQVIANYTLENCTFDGSAGLSPNWENADPSLRPTIRNITLRNTNAYASGLQGAIVEDVTVENTKAGKAPVFFRGNVYRHVLLKGRITPIEIRGKVFPPFLFLSDDEQERIMAEWDKANAAYYQNVDWALDITQASYASLTIDGVPAKLIRRNPENTAVVTRERALAWDWRKTPFSHGLFGVVLYSLLRNGYDDVVLIACPRSKNYNDDLEDLQMLRDAGVAV
jgi:hypothetical protein